MCIFDTEGFSGIYVKVRGTEDLEMLVWVNACTKFKTVNKLQKSTLWLWKKTQTMGHQRAQGNLQQEMSHWKLGKTLSRNLSHLRQEFGLLFFAHEMFQIMWSQVFPKRQLSWQCIKEHSKVMEHYHGKKTWNASKLRARTLSNDWLRIRTLVSSTVIERKKDTNLLERRIKQPTRKVEWFGKSRYECVSCKKKKNIQIWEGEKTFQTGVLKRGWWKHAFRRQWTI